MRGTEQKTHCRKFGQKFLCPSSKLEINYESPTHSKRNAFRAWQRQRGDGNSAELVSGTTQITSAPCALRNRTGFFVGLIVESPGAKPDPGRAISSVGRALRLHRRCREFESLIAHQHLIEKNEIFLKRCIYPAFRKNGFSTVSAIEVAWTSACQAIGPLYAKLLIARSERVF